MYQTTAGIWNAIAEMGPLRTEWAQEMFPLPDDLMEKAINAEVERVAAETGSPSVAAAWIVTAPLLWERVAIQRLLDRTGPMGALPVVETVDDALAIADGDYRLSPTERETLRRLLSVPPGTSPAT